VIVLSRPGPIRFILQQLSPDCRRIGTFTAPGHVGKNRIRLRARTTRILTPGTYKLWVRPLGAPARVKARSIKFVVVDEARPRGELRAALQATACVGGEPVPPVDVLDERLGDDGDEAALAGANGRDGGGGRASKALEKAADLLAPVGRLLPSGGVLGEAFGEVPEGTSWAAPALLTLVMLSVLLLGAAALPPALLVGTGLAAAVAYRRLELRIAGVAALLLAAAMYVILLLA
jgi:hypothetical protein